MSYWQFRRKLYHHFLRQWLNSLKQISWAVVALFPLAIPALIFAPLLILAMLTDPTLSGQKYHMALWSYLLLTYTWVFFQKKAILAHDYRYYDASLPITRTKRRIINTAMVFYAAKLLLVAPIGFFGVLLVSNATKSHVSFILAVEQLSPLIALIGLNIYYAFYSLKAKYAWLSLFAVPVLLNVWADTLTPSMLICIWVGAILLERLLVLPSLNFRYLPPGLLQLYARADLANSHNILYRVVTVLLLMIIAHMFYLQVKPEVKPLIGNFFGVIYAIVIASKLVELTQLNRQYHLYLHSLPLIKHRQQLAAVGYCFIFFIVFSALVSCFNIFSLTQWCYILAVYGVTQLSIMINEKYFLAIVTAVLLLAYLGSRFVGLL